MKSRLAKAVLSSVVLFGAIIYLSGCATIGMDRAKKTTDTMQALENDYQQASLQIDATNAALRNLVLPTQIDTRKAYNVYTTEVKKMEALGTRLNRHADEMQSQRDAYFEKWETSYDSAEIQELSEQRRVEMRAAYEKIPEASIGVKGALQSYLNDIREIQRYLSNDLTPQGIDSIRPTADRAVKDGDRLQESIKSVLVAIGQVRSGMVQGN
ncbi:DUF2959 family protein [Desulfurivibrio dismutans]|uniref:DUF2959 family protein n=1 Tax=Desulfurivibrio dismutans TaxID=1398908 RepID=UPI0023DB0DB4|nr:DUF2959 family protein [Desulfurivibrio alkaliphilus]MDF1614892.1 DUF2959 family protein [Desulfurivibrio alkaliphilus]